MELWLIAGLWGGAAVLRFAFLGFHSRDPERLWYNFERRGLLFQLARGLDYLTLAAFLAGAVWALWGLDGHDPYRLGKVFVVWLGLSLLERLPVHRFPRTNRPGAFEQAKLDLIVQLLLSFLVALGGTALTWACVWWRK